MYPRRREETDTDDLASIEVADDVEREETVENVRSGDGQEEMAGVGGMDGEGEEARRGDSLVSWSGGSSILFEYSANGRSKKTGIYVSVKASPVFPVSGIYIYIYI